MIGTKIYKNDMSKYTKIAIWCNKNNAMIEDKGEYYEVVAIPSPTLDELKQAKITEFKNIRDSEEVKPINNYDVDEKSLMRIDIACKMLANTQATIDWTMADNTIKQVSYEDLMSLYDALAVHSNELHVKYRELKELVENCTSKEELENIIW